MRSWGVHANMNDLTNIHQSIVSRFVKFCLYKDVALDELWGHLSWLAIHCKLALWLT